MENKLQIIFTHENGQDVANIPLQSISMRNKETAIAYLKTLFNGKYSFLHSEWKDIAYNNATNGNVHIPDDLPKVPELVKISMCITNDSKKMPKAPKWYKECHGKIYFTP